MIKKPLLKDRKKRIFVGFASAGAAGIWSYTRVLREQGYKIDFYGIGSSKFGFNTDYQLDFSTNTIVFAGQKLGLFFRLLGRYDIFHLNCMEAFFFYPLDLLILKMLGKKIVLTFRGSEVKTNLDFLPRDLAGKSKNWPSYYSKIDDRHFLSKLRRVIRAKIFVWYAEKVALTGPFLASAVDRYDEIIPYARDLSQILKVKTETHQNKIVIFHAPTVMEVKGSEYVIKAIQQLKRKYRNLEFRMPLNLQHDQLIKEMAKADIVIDQLLVGWYGGQAVEAMALKKPVISYIHPPYLNLIDFATEIPIVNSNVWSLVKDLENLIENKALREKLGVEGVKFVKKYHAPEKIAEEYRKLYLS